MARAIGITNQEISMSFFLIGLICSLISLKFIIDIYTQAPLTEFVLIIFLNVIGLMFFFMSPAWLAYLISKYNLNLFIDRISNPDYIGWLRFTKSKSFRPHIVKKGPLGQTKGMANGVKADAINRGDYTVTLANGNQAIIKSDLLPKNLNLDQCVGWQLVKQHYGLIGFRAWEQAVAHNKTDFTPESLNETKEEKDGEIQFT